MRLDFGTGTFGDMGCHIYDPVFKALALTAPLSVRSEGPAPNAWNWAINAKIHYVFPGTAFTEGKTVAVTWYDGDQRPPRKSPPCSATGSSRSRLDLHRHQRRDALPHIAGPKLLPADQFKDYPMPKVVGEDHWTQFVEACRGMARPRPTSTIPARSPKRCCSAAWRRASRRPRWSGMAPG